MNIYSSGACKGNPGPGGWAFIHFDQTTSKSQMDFYGDFLPHTSSAIKNWLSKKSSVLLSEGLPTFQKISHGGEKLTTNNRMEIVSILEAIKYAKENDSDARIFSDSAYCINTINSNWISQWIKNGWMTSSNQPVKNQDLWENLWSLKRDCTIEFTLIQKDMRADLVEMIAHKESMMHKT